MIIQYATASASHQRLQIALEAMTKQVNEAITTGYQPFGSPTITYAAGNYVAAQALVLYSQTSILGFVETASKMLSS